jgi:O-antigen/teichoic acid export membrane protein
LRRQLIEAVLVKAAAFFFAYAANYLLILTLTQAGFGRFSLVMAIASIAALFVSLGHPQIVLRTVAGVVANGNHSGIGAIWRISHLWIIGTGLAFLFLALLSLGVVSERNWAQQLIAASLILPMWALLKLHASVLHGSNLTTIGQGVETVCRPAIFCIAIGFGVLFAADHMQATTALWLNFAAFTCAFMLSIAANLYRKTYSVLKLCPSAEATNPGWFRASFSLALISASQLVIINTDIVMIGAILSDEDVAIYRTATLIALLVGGVNEVMTVVLRPRIASAYANNSLAEVVPQVRRLAILASLIQLFLLLVFLVLGQDSVGYVFGEVYAPALGVAVVLILAQAVAAFLGPVGVMLNMAHLEQAHLNIVICVIAVNIVLNFVLIPYLGLLGAAYASLTTILLWRIAGVIQFERHTGIVYLRLRGTKS